MKKIFKKKATDIENLNTTVDTEETSLELKTVDEVQKASFHWVPKLKLLPLGVASSFCLLGAIGVYVNYSIELDKNRQKVAHIADLRQLSERIEKSALLVRSADANAFNDLDTSKNIIDKLLDVLQKGGKVHDQDGAIENEFAPQLQSVNTQWKNNKPLIDTLVAQKKALPELKVQISEAQKTSQEVLDSAVALQTAIMHSNTIQNPMIAQELVLLSNRVVQGMQDIFSGESFSLEKGYSLVKDLRVLDQLIKNIRSGSTLYGIPRANNPEVVAALNNLEKSFAPYVEVTEKLTSNVPTLNNAKDVALAVSQSSRSIVSTAEKLNKEFVAQVDKLGLYRNLSALLFGLSLVFVGLLALALYERSIQLSRLAQVLKRNQNNENAVNDLFERMHPLDEGDFTQRIVLEDKFLVRIAQRIDRTREVFGDIVRKIKGTSERILSTADNTENTSQRLLEVSSVQFEKLGQSIQKVGDITNAMDEVAQSTWIAQEESNKSRIASQEGEKLVRQSIEKMDEIRNTIQESSKKIKKLGESAQAITEVTGLIQDITKQINILALNAAIQAASSGESGREFTVVAQEVQRLADDSKEATQKIEELINDIQTDTAAAVASMEKTTQEVVQGARLTDSAGKALRQIDELSQFVAEQVANAAQKLEEKSAEMAAVAFDMQDLQKISEESSEIVRITADQVESLKNISEELDKAVRGYKVE